MIIVLFTLPKPPDEFIIMWKFFWSVAARKELGWWLGGGHPSTSVTPHLAHTGSTVLTGSSIAGCDATAFGIPVDVFSFPHFCKWSRPGNKYVWTLSTRRHVHSPWGSLWNCAVPCYRWNHIFHATSVPTLQLFKQMVSPALSQAPVQNILVAPFVIMQPQGLQPLPKRHASEGDLSYGTPDSCSPWKN